MITGMHPAVARRLGLPQNPVGAPMGNAMPPPPMPPTAQNPALAPVQPMQPNSMGMYAPEPVPHDYGSALNPQAMGQPIMRRLKRLPELPHA